MFYDDAIFPKAGRALYVRTFISERNFRIFATGNLIFSCIWLKLHVQLFNDLPFTLNTAWCCMLAQSK